MTAITLLFSVYNTVQISKQMSTSLGIADVTSEHHIWVAVRYQHSNAYYDGILVRLRYKRGPA